MSNTGRSGDDIGDDMDTGECERKGECVRKGECKGKGECEGKGECKGEGIIQALNAWLSIVTYSSPTSPRHIGHIFFLL